MVLYNNHSHFFKIFTESTIAHMVLNCASDFAHILPKAESIEYQLA